MSFPCSIFISKILRMVYKNLHNLATANPSSFMQTTGIQYHSFSFSPESFHAFSSLYLECLLYLTPIHLNISSSKILSLITSERGTPILCCITFYTSRNFYTYYLQCAWAYSPNCKLCKSRDWVLVHHYVFSTFNICLLNKWMTDELSSPIFGQGLEVLLPEPIFFFNEKR